MSESESQALPLDRVVRDARQRFAAALTPACDRLLTLIGAGARGDVAALDELQHLTHRLAGRAGLIGYPALGDEAARIGALAHTAASGAALDASAARACVQAMREHAAEPPTDDTLTVLLADDDDDQRFLVGRLLQRAGFEVVTADRGLDVWTKARAARPDVIVLDVEMPGQDGFATGRQLKADPLLASVPLVFMSGHVDANTRLAGLALGAADYLTKSIDLRELVLRVQTLATGTPAAAMTVLLVDDDAEAMRVMDAHVKARGHDTRLAVDGDQAIASIRSGRPEALLLDLMLPRSSAFDLLRDLRQSDVARPRTLVLSARGREEDVTRAMELGADEYMTKPFSPRELLARLERLVKGSSA